MGWIGNFTVPASNLVLDANIENGGFVSSELGWIPLETPRSSLLTFRFFFFVFSEHLINFLYELVESIEILFLRNCFICLPRTNLSSKKY